MAHREWTENHIRELVRAQLKKLKGGESFAVEIATDEYTTGVGMDSVFNGSVVDFMSINSEFLKVSSNPDDYPELDENGNPYKWITVQYKLREKPTALIFNNKGVYSMSPLLSPTSNFGDKWLPIPSFEGYSVVGRGNPFEGGGKGNTYSDLFAFQNGLKYCLQSNLIDKWWGFYCINPEDWTFKHEEYSNSFANWSTYDNNATEHYIMMNVQYMKEVN